MIGDQSDGQLTTFDEIVANIMRKMVEVQSRFAFFFQYLQSFPRCAIGMSGRADFNMRILLHSNDKRVHQLDGWRFDGKSIHIFVDMMRAGGNSIQAEGFDPMRQFLDVMIVLVGQLPVVAPQYYCWKGQWFGRNSFFCTREQHLFAVMVRYCEVELRKVLGNFLEDSLSLAAGRTPLMHTQFDRGRDRSCTDDAEEQKQAHEGSDFHRPDNLIMKSTPVICGLDLGSWSFKIAAFNGEKFEVLTNEANFRETPSLVGYTPTERLIGEPAMIKLKTNFANTIRAPQRLLGLERHEHVLQEELKYERVHLEVGQDLVFRVAARQGQIDVTAEEVLISLVGKARNIIESHGLALSIAYVSIPAYLGQEERAGLKKCAQIALGRAVRLVQEWTAAGCQYAYTRVKQIRSLQQMRHVMFLDVGYSKVSLSLVQFGRFQARLVDWQHLPYTGAKNMDRQLSEFYNQNFLSKHNLSIIDNPKSYIKLLDAIQRQRTVLSANNDHHLNLEYLIGEEDLTHDMTREEFEYIVVPVLGDIAAAMAAIQARNCSVSLHAVELLGGASRIPCIQNMAAKIFGMEPSRTLNQGEAMVNGVALYGAFEQKLLNLQYNFETLIGRDIFVRWGKERKPLFSRKGKYPSDSMINLGNDGEVEMVVFAEEGMCEKELARVKVKSPAKMVFSLDQDKILSVKGTHNMICDLHVKPEAKWRAMQQREAEMQRADSRMGLIYEMKNDYESKLYWCRNKYEELRAFTSPQVREDIEQHILRAAHWVEEEHVHHSGGSEQDLRQFQQKMREMNELRQLCEQLESKRKQIDEVKVRYDKLSEQICIALEADLTQKQRDIVLEIMNWGQQSYQAMQNHNWTGQELTLPKLEQASIRLKIATKP